MSEPNADQAPLYQLMDAMVRGPDGPLLSHLNLEIKDRAVTVILGPAGTGKSMFLRALTGLPMPNGWLLLGSWAYRSFLRRPASQGPARWDGILLCPQKMFEHLSSVFAGQRGYIIAAELRSMSETGAYALLLDEPDGGLSEEEMEVLTKELRALSERAAVIVVTHKIAFAQSIADFAVLLCAGKIEAQGAAPGFFESPSTPLTAQFIRQGNCWPARPLPSLPTHFHWVLPDALAGTGRPGLLRDIDEDLTAMARAGVTVLISLTEEPLPSSVLRGYGISSRHFPIVDMHVPSLGPTASLCRQIETHLEDDDRVAIHCHAGLGRTGTILAAYLVWMGQDPPDAITCLRSINRGFLQTRSQEEFVFRFAEFLKTHRTNS